VIEARGEEKTMNRVKLDAAGSDRGEGCPREARDGRPRGDVADPVWRAQLLSRRFELSASEWRSYLQMSLEASARAI
jgi:hypothetical protein